MSKGSGIFRSLFRNLFLLLNLLAIAWLASCYAASVTSPLKVKYIALFSLTTPFAILINAIFIIFWLFSKGKWRSLLSFAALILCFKLVMAVFGINMPGRNDMGKGDQRVKVMTWNVHGLGIYNRPADKTIPGKILDFIKDEQPDILCLPEFYTVWNDGMKPYSRKFLKTCGYQEYRFIYDNTLGTEIYVGTAFFSKYPLEHLEEIELASNIKMMQCDVILPEDRKMRVYFIHLQSFMLRDKEKAMIEDVKNREKPLEVEASKSYARRFNTAYEKRTSQADSAAVFIRRSPYPVLICGDLNDLPGSYTYTTLKGKLLDAFAEKGLGIGRTYNQILPTLRIDYIFYDPQLLRIRGFKSPHLTLSDHNPVIANFEIAPKAQN
ncbi:endonuclease/exonuclease/phosphatase family protein [Chitinophagaceae bacterium MMS25-I14]